MVMPGVYLRHGNELVAMVETAYETESVLQELLERFPALLTDDEQGTEWLLIRREARVTLGENAAARGSLDHLFVDGDGVPTLVEVKRSSDSRIRREVVGQLLDYAANAAAYWAGDALRHLFEERCAAVGEDPESILRDAFSDVEDVEAFWATVRTNVAAERLRLVFVADSIPSELRRIVEFLNGQMQQTEVLAVEVKQYRDATGAHQTLVPRVLGQTEAARAIKSPDRRRWDRESILEAISERKGPAVAEVAQKIFDWVQARPDLRTQFGSGTVDGSFSAGYWDGRRNLWPFVLWSYGKIEMQFQSMARRPPFEDLALRAELRDRLVAIPGVELPLAGDARRPSFELELLAPADAFRQFTDAMSWAFVLADRTALR
jgi:hypothetical protein